MNFASIEQKLQSNRVPLAICMPEDTETIGAAFEASNLGYVDCIFVGNPDVMKEGLRTVAPGFSPRMVEASSPEDAAAKTVELVRQGEAKALMKGTVSTPILLKAVLNSETGIKHGNILSHVLVFEWEGQFRFVSDGGMIPHPDLATKEEIIKNAIHIAQCLGIDVPRVAVLTALEKVNPKIPSSVDAAILSKMGERKQFGNAIVEGPLALDNAISLESAHHKGLFNEVVGKADILIAPDIDTGNILGKSIVYFSQLPVGGLLVGAQVPVVLLSRAYTKDIRLNSIRLALAAGS